MIAEHDQQTQAIIAAHRHLALHGEPLAPVQFSSHKRVYRAAKSAATGLGFIEPDAQCLATAWQAMFERTGRFDARIWPDHPVDFGLRPWPRRDTFPACPKNLGLYAVLPDAHWIARMAQAGVPTLQLRFKSDKPQAIQQAVQAAVKAVQGSGALLFINDHWQAAIDAGAYGVHLGQEDLAQADLPAIRAAGLRLGLSSHGYAEMRRADQVGPSYIAMGAVFPTTLKKMQTAPQGAGRLQAYARLLRDYPLVAIGGIDASNLSAVLASDVGSIAVVRALVTATQPEAVATDLMAAIKSNRRLESSPVGANESLSFNTP